MLDLTPCLIFFVLQMGGTGQPIMAENGERGLYGTVLAIDLGKLFQFSVPA